MIDYSKLALITSADSFKADNTTITGNFSVGGYLTDMSASGMTTRQIRVPIPSGMEFCDVMIEGPVVIDPLAFEPETTRGRWSRPNTERYLAPIKIPPHPDSNAVLFVSASVEGTNLVFTVFIGVQARSDSPYLQNTTFNYRANIYNRTG